MICKHCGEDKPEEQFRLRADGSSQKYFYICKPCHNYKKRVISKLKKTAPDKPDKCECCGEYTDKLVLDHCHNSDTFRGWLCNNCNNGIGRLGDDLKSVQKAIEYLKRAERRQ